MSSPAFSSTVLMDPRVCSLCGAVVDGYRSQSTHEEWHERFVSRVSEDVMGRLLELARASKKDDPG